MDDWDEDQPVPTQNKPKRSFFSKPSARPVPPPAADVDDGTDFFRQSSASFNSVLAEQERRRKERLARKLKQRDKGGEGSQDRDQARSSSHKKRRISGDDESDEGQIGLVRSPEPEVDVRPAQSVNGSAKTRQSPRKTAAAEVIDLGDSDTDGGLAGDDGGDDLYKPPIQRRTEPKQSEVIDLGEERASHDEEDDEYSDLLARARERKRKKELEALKASLGKTTGAGEVAQGGGSAASQSLPDPPVSVLITTTIDDTKPLIVKIYLSRKIGELRRKWCEYNGLPDARSEEVIFAWRRLRQWDTTSLRRMLEGVVDFEVREDGSIVSAASARGDGLSDDLSRIHLVATTAAGLEELRREHARSLLGPADEVDDVDDENAGYDDAHERNTASPEKDAMIPILLREQKEYGELRLKVKSDTTFERITMAFRRSQKVPDDKTITLVYDGEKLDAATMMQDSEVEARDIIEVYVR